MSQVIDSRVVEMQFDNAQFERNVDTSISTLGRLKSALNFDGMTKGLDNLDQASKNVNFDHMVNSLDVLEKRFSTMGIVGMTVIQNLTNSALNFVKQGWSSVTNAIIGGGKRRAFNIENARFQLQGLLDTEKEVQDVMDNAMESVSDTAYGYDEAARAAAQFAASGMRAGDEMLSSLKAIAGTAAMANSDYESISRIFTSVAGAGRVMGNDLLQLSTRGLNAAAILAKFFNGVNDGSIEARESVKSAIKEISSGTNVTEGNIREFVTKGKISFDIFASAMDNAFGDHAKKANDTVTGVLSNIRAAFSKIGAEFISPLIVQKGPLVQFLNAYKDKLNDIKAAIVPLAGLFTETVSTILEAATRLLNGFDIKPFLRNMNEVLGLEKYFSQKELLDIFAKDVVKDVNTIKNAFTGKKDITGTGDPLGLEKSAKTYQAFEKVLIQVAKSHGIAIDEMIEAEGSFGATLKNGWLTSGLFNEAIDKITSGKFTLGAKQTASDLKEIRDLATQVIRGDWGDTWPERIERLTKEGFSEETISSARKYVNVLHKLTEGTWNLSDEIYNKADAELISSGALEGMSDAELEAMGLTQEEIELLREFGKTTSLVETPASKFLESLKEGLGGNVDVVGTLKGAFSGLLSVLGIAEDFLFALGKAVLPILADVGGRVASTFIRISGAVWGFVTKLRTTLAENDTFNKIFSALTPVLEKIANVFKMLLDIVGTFAEVGLKKLGDALPGVTKKVEGFFKKIKNTKAFKAVSGFLGDTYKTLMHKLRPLVTSEGMTKFLDGLGEKGKNAFESIKKAVKDLDLKKKLEFVTEPIKNFWDSLISPDSEIRTKFSSKIEDIKKALMSFYENIFHNPEGKSPWEAFKSWVTDNFDPIAIFESVKAKINEAAEGFDLGEELSKIKEKIKTFFSDIWKALTGKDSEVPTEGGDEGGFLDGLKSSFLKKFQDIFGEDFNFEGITKLLGSIGTLKLLFSVGGTLNQLRKTLKSARGLIDDIRGFASSLKHLAEAEAIKTEAEAVLKVMEGIALVLGVLTAMVFVIGKMDPKAAEQGFSYAWKMIALVGAIAVLIALIQKLGNKGGALSLGPLDVIAGGISKAINKLAKSLGRAATIAAIGYAISAIAKTLILLTTVKWEEADNAVTALAGIALGLWGFMVSLSKCGATNASIGTALTIVAIAFAIGQVAKTIKKFGDMDNAKLGKGLLATMLILVAIGAAMKKVGNSGSLGAALTIAVMVAALVVIVKELKVMSEMDFGSMFASVLALSALMAVLGGTISTIGSAKMDLGTLLGLLGVIGVLLSIAGALYILSTMDLSSILVSAMALAGIMVVVALVLKAVASTKGIEIGTFLGLLGVIGVILSIAGALYVLSTIDLSSILTSAIALAAILAVVAGVIAVAGTVGQGAWGPILAIAALVAVLGGIIWLLAGLEVDKTLPVIGELLLFFGGMATVLGIAGTIGIGMITGALSMIGALAILILGFAGIGALLDQFSGVFDACKSGVNKLGEVIGEFIGSILNGIMTKFSEGMNEFADAVDSTNIDEDKLAKVKELFEFMSAVTDGLPETGGLLQRITGWKDLGQFGDDLGAVAEGVGKFGEVLGKYEYGGDNQQAVVDLCNDMVAIQENLPETGGFKQKIDGWKDLGEFGNDLVNVAKGVCSFGVVLQAYEFGGENQDAIVALCKSMAEIQNELPESGGFKQAIEGYHDLGNFGDDLVNVAIGMAVFGAALDTCEFDMGKIVKVSMLALFMAAVNNTIPAIGGAKQAWEGTKDLGDFGWKLVPVALGLGTLATVISACNFDGSKITAAENLMSFMAALGGDLPTTGGLMGLLFGEQDLGGFGSNMAKVGGGIKDFMSAVNESDFSGTGFDAAKNVIDFFKQLADDVPVNKGILGKIFGGENGLGSFGDNINTVATGIGNFGTALNNVKLNKTRVNTAITLLTSLANMSSSEGLEESGKLSSFASAIGEMGDAIDNYESKLPQNLDTLITSVGCVRELIQAINDTQSINTEGIGKFKQSLTELGTTDVEGLLAPLMAQSETITNSAKSISSMMATGITQDTEGISGAAAAWISAFTEAIGEKQEDVAGAAEKVVEALNSKIEELADEVKSAAETIAKDLAEGIKSERSETTKGMKEIVENTLKELTDKQSEFQSAAITCAVYVWTGLISQNGGISDAFRAPISSALLSVNRYKSFYDAAVNNASGVYNGMNSKGSSIKTVFDSPLATALRNANNKKSQFESAGSSLGNAIGGKLKTAVNTACSAVETRINSLLTTLTNAIDAINRKAAAAKQNVANAQQASNNTGGPTTGISSAPPENLESNVLESVKDGFAKGLSQVAAYIDNGMISQPTIVPVMDLSNVQNGVAAINSLFASGGFNAINASMSGRGNSVTNADIVTAINRLEKSIASAGDTYNLNGITYDDGSNIATAVKMLTRAARMERRG